MTGTNGDALVAELAAAVGPANLDSGEARHRHAVDGVVPRVVVAPGSVEEVSQVVAAAARRRLAVTPTGLGARRGWGAPPARLDVVLSLRRLDRILRHEPADLTLSVEAGVDLAALDAVLRPSRQFLPLDPAWAERTTIGGLIATGAAGPYRARYGTMRDLLLGLTVVAGDGTVVRGGGRVVKNVTGYDMAKLHVGALGTLGVVVEAHLRLQPRPVVERSWVYGFGSAEAALEAALAVRETPVAVSRLEWLDGVALARTGGAVGHAAALAVTLGSVAEAVRAQGADVEGCCHRAGGRVLDLGDGEAWWRRVSEVTASAGPDALALRIGVRPTDLVKAWRLVEAAGPSGAGWMAVAELANGVLHATGEGVAAPAMAALVERLRGDLRALGGTCVVEQAPAAVKGELDVWGDVGPALAIMRRVKSGLDPGNVLNPGRYVGGI